MRGRHRIARPLVAALITGLGLAGCGGGDGAQDPAETPPSSTPLSGPDEATVSPFATPTDDASDTDY